MPLTPRVAVARSAAMQEALRELTAASLGTGGVLVTGETGSGREWFARTIHLAAGHGDSASIEALLRGALRAVDGSRPFVAVDCADRFALEERLFGLPRPIEPVSATELERISDSSALHAGIGGTLLLRHLPEMPTRMQGRLARILRHGEVLVLKASGEEVATEVALRPIATTERLIEAELNPDLYRRMSQFVLAVPPLRARRLDIPGLVRCLLADISEEHAIPPKHASRQAIELLTALPWRGNVAELEGLLRTLVARVTGRQIRLAHVLECVRLDGQTSISGYTGTLKEARESFERDYVQAVLERHRGRMAEAAKTLGLQRTNLYRKVRQLAVSRRAKRGQLS